MLEMTEFNKAKSYIYKNVFSGGIKTFVNASITVIAIPMIVKEIGLGNYGILSLVTLFSGMSGFFDLGLSKAMVRYNGMVEAGDRNKNVSSIILINIVIVLFVILVACGVYFMGANLFAKEFPSDPRLAPVLSAVAIFILAIEIINNMFRAYLESELKLPIVNWTFVLMTILQIGGWLFLSLYEYGIYWYIIVSIVSTLLTCVCLAILCRHMFKMIVWPDWINIKHVFILSFSFFKINVLSSIHLPLVKYMTILLLKDTQIVGIFEISLRIALLPLNALSFMTTPFFALASKYKHGYAKPLLNLVLKTTIIAAVCSLVCLVVVAVFNEEIIRYTYKYYDRQIFLTIMILLVGVLSAGSMEAIARYLQGVNRLMVIIKIRAMALVINMALLFVFFIGGHSTLVSVVSTYAITLLLMSIAWVCIFTKDYQNASE